MGFIKQQNLKVNIGAGPFGEKGWVNIDMFMYKNISFTFDCRKRLPFTSNSVEKIRCEHVLEHMDRTYEVPVFLSECKRVLKKNGIIRIVVPDIAKYIKAYYEQDWSIIGLEKNLQKGWEPANILTHVFRQNGEHKFGYDFNALKNALSESGFEYINNVKFAESSDSELRNDQPNHRLYSLYVEAKVI
jgi:predicted SAM-dependent methyltransferase